MHCCFVHAVYHSRRKRNNLCAFRLNAYLALEISERVVRSIVKARLFPLCKQVKRCSRLRLPGFSVARNLWGST